MNERIALYRDKMKVFWNNRKKGQKIALIAAPLAAILVISLASVFLNKDKFVPLYSNLSAQEQDKSKRSLMLEAFLQKSLITEQPFRCLNKALTR